MWVGIGILIGCALMQSLRTLPEIWWCYVGIGICALCVWVFIAYQQGYGRLYLYAMIRKTALGRWIGTRLAACYTVPVLLLLVGMSGMASYTLYQAHQRMGDSLSEAHEGKVSRLLVRVTDIAKYGKNSITFDVDVLSSYTIAQGIPTHIRLYWQFAPIFSLYQEIVVDKMPEVRPGQVWELSALLKRPNTLMNPGGFDNETFLFQQNIRATGTIKGKPFLRQQEQHTFFTYIQAWRHDVRAAMQRYVGNKRYGAVLIALVIGDQEGITQEDWALFNRTGMTHLVSISGSHITMLSALSVLLSVYVLKRLRYKGVLLAHYWHIGKIASGIGVIVALWYCLLAGWGIPAQRTFLMLVVGYCLLGLGVRLALPVVFILIAAFVLILDPWALFSTGFYLSFAAVAVLQQLMARFRYTSTDTVRWIRWLKEWCVLQITITLAVTPFLMYFFHQISLISPVVNAYAIFMIGTIITPLALCIGVLSVNVKAAPFLHDMVDWLADITHHLLSAVMQLSTWLSEWSWASVDTSDVPLWGLGLCGIGIVLWLLPRGLPLQRWSLLLVIPAFFFVDKPLRPGEWQLYAFDIGQGSAWLLRTASHNLLFDTGVRLSPTNESAQRVLLPALRALGVKRLDTVVVSHADLDHSGGLGELLKKIPVQRIYASFQVDKFLQQEQALIHRKPLVDGEKLVYEKALAEAQVFLPLWLQTDAYQVCQYGVSFVVDLVVFRFLNVPVTNVNSELSKSDYHQEVNKSLLPVKSGNYQSCVLSVEGKYHRVLFTGDILVQQEEQLLQLGRLNKYDVVQVPHHGSLSSSNEAFVTAVAPLIAIAQTGFHNRFRHPHPVIQQRWEQHGAVFLNTAQTGAIHVSSLAMGISYRSMRRQQRRYWHR